MPDKTITTAASPKATRYVRRYMQEHPYGNLDALAELFDEAMQEAHDIGWDNAKHAKD